MTQTYTPDAPMDLPHPRVQVVQYLLMENNPSSVCYFAELVAMDGGTKLITSYGNFTISQEEANMVAQGWGSFLNWPIIQVKQTVKRTITITRVPE
jgi:hypothetical protein